MAEKKTSFADEVRRLMTQPAIADKKYFHVTLLADDNDVLIRSVDSHWCGYTESTPRREIREASLLDGDGRRAELKDLGESALLVNEAQDFRIWLAFGGHGVILEDVARARIPDLLEPRAVARASGGTSFTTANGLTTAQQQHAPSKKVRMEVLTRDSRRCFLCGRSPANYVDVELHVHHIVPWGHGGVTEPENLVTLCKTCHDGLDPHFDWNLAIAVNEKHYPRKSEYRQHLVNYQRYVRKILQEKP